jgi:hypothetical protein
LLHIVFRNVRAREVLVEEGPTQHVLHMPRATNRRPDLTSAFLALILTAAIVLVGALALLAGNTP